MTCPYCASCAIGAHSNMHPDHAKEIHEISTELLGLWRERGQTSLPTGTGRNAEIALREHALVERLGKLEG